MTTSFVGLRTFRGRHTFTRVVGVKTSCLADTAAVIDTPSLDDVYADIIVRAKTNYFK
jgi:hypothetical protein